MLTYLDHCQIIGAILGQYLGQIRAMFWLFLQYFCFFRCLKLLNIFLQSHACPIEEYSSMLNYWTILVTCYHHIRAMFCLFLQYIFASICGKCLKFFLKSQTCQMEENSCCWKFGPYQGPFWLISGPCSGNLYHIYIPRSMEWFKFSLYCHVRPTWY